MGEMLYPPLFYYMENFKECEKMLELEETIKKLQELTEKIKNLGESL